MLAANTFTGFLIRGGMGANETQSDWCLANIRIVVQCRVTDLRPCTLRHLCLSAGFCQSLISASQQNEHNIRKDFTTVQPYTDY